ncbi:putative enzyme with 3 periplasmic binding protein-like domains [Xenorhabdus bovienii str. puntauvense]|uniref:Putative enzyme with 3 periplasmic binding protein-like domains n=1 Tax=Xenorhabdus bovienii str. puntauvense TaxID=1398201 RepID=A0A077NB50_XENBV|nr:penicillin-binding protein activator [Xenorhabdus bovienii]CDG95498.1 putative enzyme with 3 periplasmic binding protein-like domains [Xenorhabdus bovienii str. puntauvense]
MLPSIFVRFKTGLVCTALLSTMIIAGCTTPEQQGQPPSKPQDKISAEINRYQSIIDATHNQPSLDVIRAYIALETHTADDAAHQKNIDDTWQALTHLSPQQLGELVINANEYTLQGWLDLLNAYLVNKQDLDKLRTAINDWRTRYPDNPAMRSLPTSLQQMLLKPKDSHAIIGLFLPLSGQAKVFGEAIRQGFLDAQKGLPQPTLPVNATVSAPEAGIAANTTETAEAALSSSPVSATSTTIAAAPVNDQPVKVYDTNSQPLANLLAQAEQDGVTLVVGPLLKPNVEQLVQINTPLNILALNELDVSQSRSNICYFSLSPEDEAKNAALHLWQQQKRNPLVLVPRTELGNRVTKAFAEEWQKLGGNVALQQTFGTLGEMKQSINRGMGIRLSGTPIPVSAYLPDAGASQLKTNGAVIATSAPTNSAGGAVDAVYIAATTDELTLIKPMIDMAISSRKKPALYANSRSNKAGVGPDFRLEMDGMQFSDIPLLTGVNLPLMQQAASKFANDYSLMRLYAMGIDAWSLANQFTQLQQGTGFHMKGASGELSVTNNCTILRQLAWMQFNNGRIIIENNAANNIDATVDNTVNKSTDSSSSVQLMP